MYIRTRSAEVVFKACTGQTFTLWRSKPPCLGVRLKPTRQLHSVKCPASKSYLSRIDIGENASESICSCTWLAPWPTCCCSIQGAEASTTYTTMARDNYLKALTIVVGKFRSCQWTFTHRQSFITTGQWILASFSRTREY